MCNRAPLGWCTSRQLSLCREKVKVSDEGNIVLGGQHNWVITDWTAGIWEEKSARVLGCPDSSNCWHLILREDEVFLLLGHKACTEILEAVWTAGGTHGKLLWTQQIHLKASWCRFSNLYYSWIAVHVSCLSSSAKSTTSTEMSVYNCSWICWAEVRISSLVSEKSYSQSCC